MIVDTRSHGLHSVRRTSPDKYWDRPLCLVRGTVASGTLLPYLAQFDLSRLRPQGLAAETAAWHAIVDANRAPEDAEMADALDSLNESRSRHNETVPAPAHHLTDIIVNTTDEVFRLWLKDPKNRRQMPHRLETAGYVPARNDADKHDGQWKVSGKRQTIYARRELSRANRILPAQALKAAAEPRR